MVDLGNDTSVYGCTHGPGTPLEGTPAPCRHRSSLSPVTVFFTYLVVSPSVEADKCVGPEAIHSHGAEEHVGVVQLVIVANPSSNESPEGLDSGIGTESGGLLWLAACG